jgi:sarcosine oxidase, subunit beta
MVVSISEKAGAIVIGGGIFGCAIAYYYTKNNPGKKIIVLERNEICNAATSRAAALLTRVRAKKYFIPLTLQTYRAVAEMERQLNESMGMKKTGAVHIAVSKSSVADLDALMQIANEFNEPAEYLNHQKVTAKLPWLKTDEVLKAGFMPLESYCDPYLLGTFFARCAKMHGADIRQGVEVNSLLMEGHTVVGVATTSGNIYANAVVIAAGAWSPVLAMQAGVGIPMAPVRSQYWITERHNLFPADSPIVILPDAQAYARPEGGSLLFGIREKISFAISPIDIPKDISQFSFSPDGGVSDLSEVIDKLARFFPAVYNIGLKNYIAGFSGYTPDNNLSMGIVPGIENLFAATGCVGAGIAVAGGVGYALAELMAGRPNPYDFTPFNINRFGRIDPFGKAWLDKCSLARSQKRSG